MGPRWYRVRLQLLSLLVELQPAFQHALTPCTHPSTQRAHSPAHTLTLAVSAAHEFPLAVSAHVLLVPMSSVDSLCSPCKCAPLPLMPL